MLQESRVRIGIIGCGTISRNVHVPVLLALPLVELVWLADTNKLVGDSLSRASGVHFHHVSPATIELPSADMIVIAIPNGARPAYYEYLAGRKEIGLYVEKPFARSVAEHGRIVSGRYPWQVAVGLDRRSFGLTRLAKELFQHLPFGNPLSMTVEFGGLGRVIVGDSYMADASLAGGGDLYQMGVHFLDAALFASGAVDAQLRRGRLITSRELDIHVEGHLSLTLANRATLPLSILVTQLQAATNLIQIVFERATVSFSIMYGQRGLHVSSQSNGSAHWTLVPEATTGPLELFASFGLHWTNAIKAFRTRTENYTNASQALLTSQVLELLYAIPPETDLRHDSE